jgi:integrase
VAGVLAQFGGGVTRERNMVRRPASGAGIETAIACHTFRATGITDHLTNGRRIEVAQRMAGHSNVKTTGLYERRNDDISVGDFLTVTSRGSERNPTSGCRTQSPLQLCALPSLTLSIKPLG